MDYLLVFGAVVEPRIVGMTLVHHSIELTDDVVIGLHVCEKVYLAGMAQEDVGEDVESLEIDGMTQFIHDDSPCR
jgi:hypothetical protein